jgi:hypothetical protein
MVTMPDGAKFYMQWKQVKYVNGNNSIIFDIMPMFKGNDLIIFPNAEQWNKIVNIFNSQERKEIIFLLERINWKRDIKIVEINIVPAVNSDFDCIDGSLESTEGYKRLSDEDLFDPQSPLSKEQVKEIYCELERRFAENASGTITISKDFIIKDSVLEKVSIPALKNNEKVNLQII